MVSSQLVCLHLDRAFHEWMQVTIISIFPRLVELSYDLSTLTDLGTYEFLRKHIGRFERYIMVERFPVCPDHQRIFGYCYIVWGVSEFIYFYECRVFGNINVIS